jgi:PP-loop family
MLPAHSTTPTLDKKKAPLQSEKHQKALITLSGGQDSSVAAWLLFQTQVYYRRQPLSLYYQHFWQRDALYANKHCAQFSFWLNWETVYYQAAAKYGTEKEARDWRETTTARLGNYYICTHVFKGHSRTDYYETLFNRLLHTTAGDQATPTHVRGTVKLASTPWQYAHPRKKSTLFVQQQDRSCWVFPQQGKTVGETPNLYHAIKYGT